MAVLPNKPVPKPVVAPPPPNKLGAAAAVGWGNKDCVWLVPKRLGVVVVVPAPVKYMKCINAPTILQCTLVLTTE